MTTSKNGKRDGFGNESIVTMKEGDNLPKIMMERVFGGVTFENKYSAGTNELLIVLPGLTENEINATKEGSMVLGMMEWKSVIFFLYLIRKDHEMSRAILNGDCPFNLNLVPPQIRSIPTGDEAMAHLQIILVEETDRVIKAIRNVGLPGQFTRYLYEAINRQSKAPFDKEVHYREVMEGQ
jgi:hypothetical protein